ncbi:MAG: DMT family transporter [bacterium]|jgi:drug/metabolite transporter (DMT)-like permease
MLTFSGLTLRAYIPLMTLQLFLVSGTYLFAKLGTAEIPVIPFALLRFCLSGLVLWLFCLATGRIRRIERRDWAMLALLSILLIPINQGFFLFGQNLSRTTHGALIYSLAPIFVALFAGIYLKETVPAYRWAGILLSVVGASVVISGQGISWANDSFRGDVLILVAMLSWVAFTVAGKEFVTKYGAFFSMTAIQLVGLAMVLPLFPLAYRQYSASVPVSPIGWISLLYVSLGTSVLSYALWYWALARVETAKLGVLMSLQPMVAAVYSYAAFGAEEITLPFVVGGVLAIFGVWMAHSNMVRRPPDRSVSDKI